MDGDDMKDKILVTIIVPIIDEEYDMYIPIRKKVGTVKNLIIKMVEELSNHAFVDDGCKRLYDRVSGNVIDEAQFVRYSSIKNGSKLILY